MRLVLIFIIKSSTQQMRLTEYESDNINCLCLELRMHEKRLKIPEGQSEVVNRRKTDNTMGK